MTSMGLCARRAFLALVAAGLGGCVAGPSPTLPEADDGPRFAGQVAAQAFDPAEALEIGRVVLDSHESFLLPIGDPSNQPPIYPEARLADRLPHREVCLRLAVAADGRVFSVDDVTGLPGCEVQGRAEADFVASATRAARDWRFEPAVRCVFRTAAEKTAAANTGCAGAQEIPQAVSLHFRFVFEQKEGRGAVRWVR
jgi:hypothetical protein